MEADRGPGLGGYAAAGSPGSGRSGRAALQSRARPRRNAQPGKRGAGDRRAPAGVAGSHSRWRLRALAACPPSASSRSLCPFLLSLTGTTQKRRFRPARRVLTRAGIYCDNSSENLENRHSGRQFLKTLFLAFLLVLMPIAYAHHSHANLDRDNIQQHTGVVTKYSWRMPHVFLQVQGPNQAGDLVNWSIELLHPAGMIQWGWGQDTFNPGDRITWEGAVDKNPNRHYSGLHWAEKADGTRLSLGRVIRGRGARRTVDRLHRVMGTRRKVRFHYEPPADWLTAERPGIGGGFDRNTEPAARLRKSGPPSRRFCLTDKDSSAGPGGPVLDYEMPISSACSMVSTW